ncbi:MAG: hypothetical protein AAF773_04305 [Cyanobacteria bacterium P01_D01_bin.115]
MPSEFIIKCRRNRSNTPPASLEFGELYFTDLDNQLHIGKADGTPHTVGGNSGTAQPGPKGDSAYQVWLNAGNTGTEADFFESLRGPRGISGGGLTYHPVVPRVRELSNVAVPSGGQVYQLSAVPSDRPVIAVLHLFAGIASIGGHLSVVCEPVAPTQSVPLTDYNGLGDSNSFFSSSFLTTTRTTLIVPTSNGQLYRTYLRSLSIGG